MRNILKGAAVAAVLSASAIVAAAPAAAQVRPPYVGASATVKWSTVGIIGVAGALVGYDLIRRFSCTGDFLKLGGPGFDGPVGNNAVMPPRRCAAR